MFGLSKLWAAVARLAGAIESLADTTTQVNEGLRARLGLDAPEREQLPHVNGEVAEEPEPVKTGRGKRKQG